MSVLDFEDTPFEAPLVQKEAVHDTSLFIKKHTRSSDNEWSYNQTKGQGGRVRLITFFFLVSCSFLNAPIMSVAVIAMSSQFGWTAEAMGYLHSGFFYGFGGTQIIGGVIADRFGGKLSISIGVLGMSLFLLVTPLAAQFLPVLVLIRVLMGLSEGVQSPSVHNLVAHWFPLSERNLALALIRSGGYAGMAFAYLAAPEIVDKYGWDKIWYLFGALGVAWFLCFSVSGASTPAEHKSIGLEELQHIEETAETDSAAQIPWKQFFGSSAFWAVVAAHFCHDWGWYTMVNWMPTYYHSLGVTSEQSSWYSAVPFFVNLPSTALAGATADYCVRKHYSLLHIRRLFTCLGMLVPAVCYALTNVVESPEYALLLICTAFSFDAFNVGGYLINNIDIGPKYAGSIKGVSDTVGCCAGVLSNTITGLCVFCTGRYDTVFIVIACFKVVGAVVFCILAHDKVVFK